MGEYRSGLGVALAVFAIHVASGPAAAQTVAPEVRFHVGAEELAPAGDDVAWVRDRAGELVSWWEERGAVFLGRAGAFAGLPWPYRDIEVYLVRSWPVVSIEYPLVLAVGTTGQGGTGVEIPDDEDFQVLLLAHQLVHYLLDDPAFLPEDLRPDAYEHPFLAPGDLEVEAMVNWITYAVLEGMWGRQRLEEATAQELWRSYNPNHDYVVDELMPRWRLAAGATLAQWLGNNPRGSEIFRVHDAYARQRREPEPTPEVGRNLSGTPYGIDLGATFDGEIFVAFIDPASAGDRAGVRQGDVLITIEGREVGHDVVDAQRRLDDSWDDGEINISVQREGREIFVTIGRL